MTSDDRVAQLEATVADQAKQLADLSQRVSELGERNGFTMNPVSGRNPLLQKYASLGAQVFQSIKAGKVFNDTLGKFWPLVVSKAGDVTLNSSQNHKTSLRFHNTAVTAPDTTLGFLNGTNMLMGPDSSGSTTIGYVFIDRNSTTGAYGWYMIAQAGAANVMGEYLNGVGTTFYSNGRILNSKADLVASTTAEASLNIPHGSAPTNPVNGDIWTTSAGLFVRINGVTVGPLT